MLKKLKLLLGITDDSKDELLRILLDYAEEEVVNYTHNYDLEKLQNVIIQVAVWRYNKMGSEGLDSENYSGVSFNYSASYPDMLMRQLQSYRRLCTLG